MPIYIKSNVPTGPICSWFSAAWLVKRASVHEETGAVIEEPTMQIRKHTIPVELPWSDRFMGPKKFLKINVLLFYVIFAEHVLGKHNVPLIRQAIDEEQWQVQ